GAPRAVGTQGCVCVSSPAGLPMVPLRREAFSVGAARMSAPQRVGRRTCRCRSRGRQRRAGDGRDGVRAGALAYCRITIDARATLDAPRAAPDRRSVCANIRPPFRRSARPIARAPPRRATGSIKAHTTAVTTSPPPHPTSSIQPARPHSSAVHRLRSPGRRPPGGTMHHPTDSTQTGPRLPAREPREAAHDADRSHGHGYSLGRTLDARDPWGRHEAYEAAAISVGENFANVTRIDAHCHSYASSRPLNRALEVINCPECYSPPEKVFDQAMARGMDLVTITDHDEIRGAMELVERGFQRFIVGEEVSVFFPEDHCLMHVLVWGITPEQHEDIARLGLREDIYQFAALLREQDLPHACAHPLYVQNGRLTRWHVERCALLFKCFECLNGAH